MNDFLIVALQILVTASPFVLAALGGLVSEFAGRLNIGLEGMMLSGAFTALALAKTGLGLVAAIAGGMCAGMIWGAGLAFVGIRGGANVFIAGLAINLLVSGLVGFAGSWLFGTRSVIALGERATEIRAWVDPVFVILSIVVCFALWLFLRSTRAGFRLLTLGSRGEMLVARGIDVDSMRMWAIVVSGALAGLAGAQLSLDLGAFVPNQSAGKGWIALVLIFAGAKKPFGVALAALAFALLGYWSTEAQAKADHPALLVALPFVAVLLGLVVVQSASILIARARKQAARKA